MSLVETQKGREGPGGTVGASDNSSQPIVGGKAGHFTPQLMMSSQSES